MGMLINSSVQKYRLGIDIKKEYLTVDVKTFLIQNKYRILNSDESYTYLVTI